MVHFCESFILIPAQNLISFTGILCLLKSDEKKRCTYNLENMRHIYVCHETWFYFFKTWVDIPIYFNYTASYWNILSWPMGKGTFRHVKPPRFREIQDESPSTHAQTHILMLHQFHLSQQKGPYMSGQLIWNTWNKTLVSFINYILNVHKCKILFIRWLF